MLILSALLVRFSVQTYFSKNAYLIKIWHFWQFWHFCSTLPQVPSFMVWTKGENLAFSGSLECPKHDIKEYFSIFKLWSLDFLNQSALLWFLQISWTHWISPIFVEFRESLTWTRRTANITNKPLLRPSLLDEVWT